MDFRDLYALKGEERELADVVRHHAGIDTIIAYKKYLKKKTWKASTPKKVKAAIDEMKIGVFIEPIAQECAIGEDILLDYIQILNQYILMRIEKRIGHSGGNKFHDWFSKARDGLSWHNIDLIEDNLDIEGQARLRDVRESIQKNRDNKILGFLDEYCSLLRQVNDLPYSEANIRCYCKIVYFNYGILGSVKGCKVWGRKFDDLGKDRNTYHLEENKASYFFYFLKKNYDSIRHAIVAKLPGILPARSKDLADYEIGDCMKCLKMYKYLNIEHAVNLDIPDTLNRFMDRLLGLDSRSETIQKAIEGIKKALEEENRYLLKAINNCVDLMNKVKIRYMRNVLIYSVLHEQSGVQYDMESGTKKRAKEIMREIKNFLAENRT